MKDIFLLFLCLLSIYFAGAQTISGVIDYPVVNNGCGNSSYCCDYGDSTNPLANVKVIAENLMTNVTDEAFSDAQGNFSLNVGGGTIKLTPVVNDPNWLNGVSTFDLIKTQQYVNGVSSENLSCAFRRIAADVNADGQITSADIDATRDLILGYTSSYSQVPNWNSVPKVIVDDYDLHPQHSNFGILEAFFWDMSMASNPFSLLFNSTGTAAGVSYFYSGTGSTYTVALDYWPVPYHDEGDCLLDIPFGFYMFKSGDVSGNANKTFTAARPFQGPRLMMANNDKSDYSTLRSKETYTVSVRVQYPEPILGWQMGFEYDVNAFKGAKLIADHSAKKLQDRKHFNFKEKNNKKGALCALWFAQEEEDLLDATRGAELFRFELKTNAKELELEELIKLSFEALRPEFINSNEVDVTDKVQLQILIE